MNCRTCNYPLWNLPGRNCPECGSAFAPSDFEFVVNSVRFCCPRCGQPYYGTGQRGQLEPRRFNCVRCGQLVDADEMIMLPELGVDEAASTQVDRMPWFERDDSGLVKAWFATIGAAMLRPQGLIRAVPPAHPVWSAWRFMFVSNLVFFACNAAVGVVITALVFGVMSATGVMPPGLTRLLVLQTGGIVVASIVLLAVGPVIWAAMTHAVLVITGGVAEPMRRTAHAIHYSAGANALSAIPFDCVKLAAQIWWVVSATLMVKEAQRCHGGRAALAVVGSSVVLGIGMMVALIAFLVLPLALGGATAFVNAVGGQVETRVMTTQLRDYAADHGGRGPPHAALMLSTGDAAAADFVTFESATAEVDVAVGAITLHELQLLPANRLRMAAQEAADALPDGVVAHRLGDYVFTYHDADLSMSRGLWIVVQLDDPEVNGPPRPADMVYIGLDDGSVTAVSYGRLQPMLDAQNLLRASEGLSPIPEPGSVAHGQPAVASQQLDEEG